MALDGQSAMNADIHVARCSRFSAYVGKAVEISISVAAEAVKSFFIIAICFSVKKAMVAPESTFEKGTTIGLYFKADKLIRTVSTC